MCSYYKRHWASFSAKLLVNIVAGYIFLGLVFKVLMVIWADLQALQAYRSAIFK